MNWWIINFYNFLYIVYLIESKYRLRWDEREENEKIREEYHFYLDLDLDFDHNYKNLQLLNTIFEKNLIKSLIYVKKIKF